MLTEVTSVGDPELLKKFSCIPCWKCMSTPPKFSAIGEGNRTESASAEAAPNSPPATTNPQTKNPIITRRTAR